MLTWIFFDVGNVILNDDPAQARAFELLHQALLEEGRPMSFEDLLAERRRLWRERGGEASGSFFQVLGQRLLGPEKWPQVLASMTAEIFPRWAEYNPLIPGIREVVAGLRDGFRLGLIANQPAEVVEVLRGHGLWDLFAVRGISALVGYHKPDEAFFTWALAEAGCEAGKALMIGDRVDHDMVPAARLGMKTLRLLLHPADKGYRPQGAFAEAYFREIVSCHEEGDRRPPDPAVPFPTVTAVREIPGKVQLLSGRAA